MLKRSVRRGLTAVQHGLDQAEARIAGSGDPKAITIRSGASVPPTAVDAFWGEHTVHDSPFLTARQSLRHLRWRARVYPLFESLMELYGDHRGDVVVDYGCGPGNDVVGFLVLGNAREVIGIDVSRKALELARLRLALHRGASDRVTLIQVADGNVDVPLEDASVDLVYCEGVLHHTSDPNALLSEFRRILKPGARAAIMVYNRSSIYYHLYTAYQRQVLEGAFAGLPIDEAFRQNTDGEDCPISRAYEPDAFAADCSAAGFEVRFVGGYFAAMELDLFMSLGAQAISDTRLAEEHRAFLRDLTVDADGYPRYHGSYAGIGGVYHLVAAPVVAERSTAQDHTPAPQAV